MQAKKKVQPKKRSVTLRQTTPIPSGKNKIKPIVIIGGSKKVQPKAKKTIKRKY